MALIPAFMCVYTAEYTDCKTECRPEQSCVNLLECRMAEIDCQQSCRQRQVIENLAEVLEKIAISMDSASIAQLAETEILTQPITVPADETMKERKTPFTQIDRGSAIIISNP